MTFITITATLALLALTTHSKPPEKNPKILDNTPKKQAAPKKTNHKTPSQDLIEIETQQKNPIKKTSKKAQSTKPKKSPPQEPQFPNILENLDKAPPFGNPKAYKEWKKSHLKKSPHVKPTKPLPKNPKPIQQKEKTLANSR
jgi:hypothetical protein